MRTISVSTDVFAKIWAKRLDGENSEDEILRRILEIKHDSNVSTSSGKATVGFYDEKFDVTFEPEFEIFRNYKGKEYRARASRNRWILLNTNQAFPTLNSLSDSIVSSQENAWGNWKYRDENNRVQKISDLRDPTKIQRRKSSISLFDIGK